MGTDKAQLYRAVMMAGAREVEQSRPKKGSSNPLSFTLWSENRISNIPPRLIAFFNSSASVRRSNIWEPDRVRKERRIRCREDWRNARYVAAHLYPGTKVVRRAN